jgi:type IV pilus assembly protein PilV
MGRSMTVNVQRRPRRRAYSDRRARYRIRRDAGFSLIEVLVTVVLLAIGLLGLAALQAHATLTSIEAYQRTQALLLVHDMIERIRANKPDALRYIGANYGAGAVVACAAQPGVERDLCVWSNALAGAAEQLGMQSVGTLTHGRGCIAADADNRILVVVAWQGLAPTLAPALDCARNQYGDDAYRRAVALPAHLPPLGG